LINGFGTFNEARGNCFWGRVLGHRVGGRKWRLRFCSRWDCYSGAKSVGLSCT
jgi:hypothetical protein